jgi:pimeloyl-ACP methyl ester carboxylesterase
VPEITAANCRFYYELDGPPEAEVLVLSNGILMSTASWGYQVPALARRYRVLRYDCRGQWQSDHPAGPYTMEGHAADMACLLDALGIERAHIAGISYGAELSMIFAYRYPERTRSLIVSSAVSEIGPTLRGVGEMWLAAAEKRDPDLFFAATYPFNFSERWIAANGASLNAARERYRLLDFDAVSALCRAFLGLNITRELHGVTAPTLIMVGEEDNLKPRAYADIIAREIPHAAYAIIPRAGHALCWEAPLAFNSLVLGFLEQAKGGNAR